MSNIRFSRVIVLAALIATVMVMVPSLAVAHERIGIGVGFYGGGPFYPYGYGPWGYPYGPYGYGPYYAPYGYGYPGRPLGEVHIKSPDSNAQIFINGAYAGRAHDMKKIYLAPGTYNFEQRIGSDVQKERIYVLANRSLTLEFEKPGMGHNVPPPPQPQVGTPPAPQNAPAPDSAPAPAPAPAPEAQIQQ